jgi:CHAD domain-containing protein
LIYSRIAAARAYAPWLTDAPVERLHMLRIEFKKLRYTVEYFAEVLGKRSFEVINALKQIQDHLGDLNDAQVATQIIGDFIEGWDVQQQALPIQERQNIEGVVNYLAARHAERYQLQVTFQAAWDAHFYNKSFRRYLAQAVSVL